MNEIINLLPALLAGIVLGWLFFGGLLFTVRLGLSSKRPHLLFFGSMVIRMAIVVVGFYYVGGDNWQKMIACLGGFLIARVIITQIAKQHKQSRQVLRKEVRDEN